jgi:hypothetical protein
MKKSKIKINPSKCENCKKYPFYENLCFSHCNDIVPDLFLFQNGYKRCDGLFDFHIKGIKCKKIVKIENDKCAQHSINNLKIHKLTSFSISYEYIEQLHHYFERLIHVLLKIIIYNNRNVLIDSRHIQNAIRTHFALYEYDKFDYKKIVSYAIKAVTHFNSSRAPYDDDDIHVQLRLKSDKAGLTLNTSYIKKFCKYIIMNPKYDFDTFRSSDIYKFGESAIIYLTAVCEYIAKNMINKDILCVIKKLLLFGRYSPNSLLSIEYLPLDIFKEIWHLIF